MAPCMILPLYLYRKIKAKARAVSPNQAGSRARCPAQSTQSMKVVRDLQVRLGWQAKARAASPASQVWSSAFVFVLMLRSSI